MFPQITTAASFLTRFVFTPRTNHPLQSSRSLAGFIFMSWKIVIYSRYCCFAFAPVTLPRRLAVEALHAQETASALEAEAEFTYLCCPWYRLTSSVVMVTRGVRANLHPKARHRSCGSEHKLRIHENCHFLWKNAHRNLGYLMSRSHIFKFPSKGLNFIIPPPHP